MIRVCPWDDLAALAVFNRLDVHDHIEAEIVRGTVYTAPGLFADWRMAQGQGPLSLIARTHPAGRPFAVIALGNTGQAGVAQAALLAADHDRHRLDLARLAVAIRQRMPAFAAETGINRIEARAWAGHPTAARLLAAMGFTHEADLPAFGRDGRHLFRQFAWTASIAPPEDLPPATTPTQTEEVF
jgi:hypothetical protein